MTHTSLRLADDPAPRRRPAVEVGLVEWFRPGEHERVEAVLADMRQLGIEHLRTGVSWADWHTGEAEKWYDWLMPRLAGEVAVLPCCLYTPPSEALAGKTSSPPVRPRAYADFLDVLVSRYGRLFEAVELWNEPNNIREWDWTYDPQWLVFSEMIGSAAYWMRHRGKKVVLGGMSPIDPNWLRLMFQRGVMDYVDVVGVHGFPATFDHTFPGWHASLARVAEVIAQHKSKAQVWITECGFSTWRHEYRRQLREFLRALCAPTERVYWYSHRDLSPGLATVDGFHSDEREYHFGLRDSSDSPKLLMRLWQDYGLDGLRRQAHLTRPARLSHGGHGCALITGGAGFVGTNLAHRLASQGRSVLLYDSIARPGVERNLAWLRGEHGNAVQVEVADMRDCHALRQAVSVASEVYHLAAQVAVTTSLDDPRHDHDVNVGGTMNLLEAIRTSTRRPPILFTSTNKVYGDLCDLALRCNGSRYEPAWGPCGISEKRNLDFHSPYGCSKGAADQYVLDYARSFGLRAVVFRMSCIYGPHQLGTEDQGWVAHFLIRALQHKPITLYGDGMQVRDVLFVEDLLDAMELAMRKIDRTSGAPYNIGGGSANTISLVELIDLIEQIHGVRPDVEFSDWRTGDQRYYVSDSARFRGVTGWTPSTSVRQGVRLLYDWLVSSRRAPASTTTGMKGAVSGYIRPG
jgi:CDP-paratose 2-epimerase